MLCAFVAGVAVTGVGLAVSLTVSKSGLVFLQHQNHQIVQANGKRFSRWRANVLVPRIFFFLEFSFGCFYLRKLGHQLFSFCFTSESRNKGDTTTNQTVKSGSVDTYGSRC